MFFFIYKHNTKSVKRVTTHRKSDNIETHYKLRKLSRLQTKQSTLQIKYKYVKTFAPCRRPSPVPATSFWYSSIIFFICT